MASKNKVIIFDLDDTLYKEIDFLKSAYKAIIKCVLRDFSVQLDFEVLYKYYINGENVFDKIIEQDSTCKLRKEYLLNIYRNHLPDNQENKSTVDFLNNLKGKGYILGVISDGRSITQRNKLKALGIDKLIDEVLISEEFGSEKPNEKNYLFFEFKYPGCEYYYIADNIVKDFVTPNKLAWQTFGIRDVTSLHIHSQKITVPKTYLPKIWLDRIEDISIYL